MDFNIVNTMRCENKVLALKTRYMGEYNVHWPYQFVLYTFTLEMWYYHLHSYNPCHLLYSQHSSGSLLLLLKKLLI